MRNGLLMSAAALMVLVMMTSAATAGDGVPSQAKLSKLGLSSMQVASDEQGQEVRGAALAVVGGRYFASSAPAGFGIFGFGGFGFPLGVGGGGSVFQSASAFDGEAPNFAGNAFAATGTFDPTTTQPGPIVVESAVTFNGFTGLSRTTVSGGVFAISGTNFFGP